MSLDDSPVTVNFELLSPDAEVLGTASLSLPGKGHAAKFIDELTWTPEVDLTEMEGMIRATVFGKISALILQSRPGQFATLPVVPLENR